MNKNTSCAFILNPSANRNRARARIQKFRDQISQNWPHSSIYISASKSELRQIVEEAALKHEVIIACGGDGTVNEVFSAAFGLDVTLGVLPMGTGNDFAKALGLPVKADRAIQLLKHAKVRKIDAVAYEADGNQGFMFNTMGIGLDGKINHEASQITRLKGSLRYIVAALKSVFAAKPVQFDMNIDGVASKETLFMLTVANGGVEGGNFKVSPESSNFDGKLEVVRLKPMWPLPMLLLLPLFLIGKQKISSKVVISSARELRLSLSSPMPVHVDGEQIGLELSEFAVRVHPASVRVLVPAGSDT